MKRVLITGKNSYIGEAVRDYLTQYPCDYEVFEKDTIDWNPKPVDFDNIDVVFNVAGIAHTKENRKNRKLYYDINNKLVVKIAKAAKSGGVKQFILLSTMSVYGLTVGHITKQMVPHPISAYGKSKLLADMAIKKMSSDAFKFACLRPPMVYGKGCKGNYQRLRKFALKSPVFPDYPNDRSMIYIGNLCEFIKQIIDFNKSGLFFPQNSVYINTSNMVKMIAKYNKRNIYLIKIFNIFIKYIPFNLVKKVFGSLTYEYVDLIDKYGFEKSILLTEKKK